MCAGIAGVSLALPATLAFDPWAWLVWGREVGHLQLDTTGGPSWKPLPVLATTPLSVAGDHAPTLWLLLARTAGLLAVVVTYRLAARFAGSVAGAVAAGLLLLTPDGGPRFLRLVVEGHTAPLTATLGLWAVDRHLAGRHTQALLLATAFSLDRPEAWPFLGTYALWLWRCEPARRPLVATALSAVPVLWFGGDWWGSGDAWHGADAAQVVSSGVADRVALAWERVAKVVVTPAWVAAAVALVTAWRRRERALLALGAGAAAWLALVGMMSVTLGYAALSRFLLPAAAALCVLAGVGVTRAVAAVPRGAARFVCLAAIAVLSLPFVVTRVESIGTVADGVTARAELEHQLDVVLERAGGPEAVVACGRVVVRQSEVPRVAMAWKLDVPLDRVERDLRDRAGVVFVRAGRAEDARLAARPAHEVTELGRSDEWVAFAVGCDPHLDRRHG
ncbi:MAG: hypothetical protein JXA83_08020 [Acidimicrobiales bacterium]|nr:hypothetical protein [Acidimicrobiales bacterium]